MKKNYTSLLEKITEYEKKEKILYERIHALTCEIDSGQEIYKKDLKSTYSDKIEFLKQEICTKKEDITDYKQKIISSKEEITFLKNKIETLTKELKDAKEENENINGHYLAYRATTDGYIKENTLLKAQNNKHIDKLYSLATAPKSSVINQNTITNTKNSSQTINNVIQLQPFDLNDEQTKNNILSAISDISDEKFEAYVKNGQQGIADAMFNEVFLVDGENNYYQTADTSRHIFEYKSTNGQIMKDKQAFKLLKVVHPKILDRTRSVTRKHLKETKDYDLTNIINQRLLDITILPKDNKKFCTQLTKITEKKNENEIKV